MTQLYSCKEDAYRGNIMSEKILLCSHIVLQIPLSLCWKGGDSYLLYGMALLTEKTSPPTKNCCIFYRNTGSTYSVM